MRPCSECAGLVHCKTAEELEAHVRSAHGYLTDAQVQVVLAGRRPEPVTVHDADPHAPPPPSPAPYAGGHPRRIGRTPKETTMKSTTVKKTKRCWRCKRSDGTHRDGCPGAVCKTCQRVSPDKCKRHGGPSHSTAFGRRAGRKTVGVAKKPAKKPAKTSAALAAGAACRWCHRAGGTHTVLCRRGAAGTMVKIRSTLFVEIRRLKEVAARGREAQRELDRIRKALVGARGA